VLHSANRVASVFNARGSRYYNKLPPRCIKSFFFCSKGIFLSINVLKSNLKRCKRFNSSLACSRRSDSGARAKKKASERAGKTRGDWGRVSPRFVPALSLAFFFARAPLSERLEQATHPQLVEQLLFTH